MDQSFVCCLWVCAFAWIWSLSYLNVIITIFMCAVRYFKLLRKNSLQKLEWDHLVVFSWNLTRGSFISFLLFSFICFCCCTLCSTYFILNCYYCEMWLILLHMQILYRAPLPFLLSSSQKKNKQNTSRKVTHKLHSFSVIICRCIFTAVLSHLS